MALEETVRDSQQQLDYVRDMQNLQGIGKFCEKQAATMEDSERQAATPWNWERQ